MAPAGKRSNFGKNDLKLLQLAFRFRFKLFDSFEGGCFDCNKNSTTTSIRAISPKYCKARLQYFRVADILVQACLIDAYNVRVFGVHQVLEAMESSSSDDLIPLAIVFGKTAMKIVRMK